jgi:hypothetical protein
MSISGISSGSTYPLQQSGSTQQAGGGSAVRRGRHAHGHHGGVEASSSTTDGTSSTSNTSSGILSLLGTQAGTTNASTAATYALDGSALGSNVNTTA